MKRLFVVFTLMAVCLVGVLVGPTPSQAASAQPQVGVQTTCYGGRVGFSTTAPGTIFGPDEVAYTGPYYASTRCRDINIKFSSNPHPTYVSAFRCRDYYRFTSWKSFSDVGVWHVVAYDVIDNTCFYLGFKSVSYRYSYNVSGVTAY
jgi:hypothetical protein